LQDKKKFIVMNKKDLGIKKPRQARLLHCSLDICIYKITEYQKTRPTILNFTSGSTVIISSSYSS